MNYTSSTGWDQLISQQYLVILTEPKYTCGYSAILQTLNGKPGLSYTLTVESAAARLLLCYPLRWSRDLIH